MNFPSSGELFWVSYSVLWVATVAQGCLLLALARAYSRRLDLSLQGRSEKHGPAVGGKAPRLQGRVIRAEPNLGGGAPRLVLFMDANCDPCREARAVVSWFAERYGHLLRVIVTCRGDSPAVSEFAGEFDGPVTVVEDSTGENPEKWRVQMSPFALLLDADDTVIAKRARVALQDLEVLLKTRVRAPVELDERPVQVALR